MVTVDPELRRLFNLNLKKITIIIEPTGDKPTVETLKGISDLYDSVLSEYGKITLIDGDGISSATWITRE